MAFQVSDATRSFDEIMLFSCGAVEGSRLSRSAGLRSSSCVVAFYIFQAKFKEGARVYVDAKHGQRAVRDNYEVNRHLDL